MTINSILPLSILRRNQFLTLFYDPIEFSINRKSTLYFHVLRIDGGSFVLERLFTEMANNSLGYVYSRNKLNELWNDKSNTVEFVTNAQEKFKAPDPTAGEGGELLLYSFLEGHLGAPKILSKMELKTSSEHYVHGSDGVHLLESEPSKYQLIFGESKMYADIRQGIKSAFKSMGEIKQKRFEFDTWLIKSELLKESIDPKGIKLLPSASNGAEIRKTNSFGVFLGFEIDVTTYPFEDHDDAEIENYIRSRAEETIVKEIRTIRDEITKRSLGGHHFHFYSIPFLKENINGTLCGIDNARFDMAAKLSGKSTK